MNDLTAMVLLLAFGLDLLFGDPPYALHPVRLIGRIIAGVERVFRAWRCAGLAGGGLFMLTVLGLTVLAYWGLRHVLGLGRNWLAVALDVFMVYSCIALRDLLKHATPIAAALDRNNLPEARRAVQKIVGRDTAGLDAHGVARAAVESVAESFVDGVLAPILWYVGGAAVAGLARLDPLPWAVTAILVYRATNTLDSMVGHQDERYLYFGRASARLDDLLNFIPARLAMPVLFAASAVCGLNSRAGWKTAWRDRLKHPSPNSAHTESFAAGALGLRLGGPLQYSDSLVEKPWLGDGTPEAVARDIRAVCRLILCAGGIAVVMCVIVLAIIGQL